MFYRPRLKKADYKLWINLERWFLYQAIFLGFGYEPPENEKERDHILFSEFYTDELSKKIRKIFKIACRINWSTHPSHPIPLNKLAINVHPKTYLLWANKIGIDTPSEFNILLASDTKNKNEIKPIQKDKFGQEAAKQRWAPHKEHLNKAVLLAEKKWESGDEALHDEMATYILGREEFKELKNKRPALLRALNPIGRKYGRVRGLKGSLQNK